MQHLDISDIAFELGGNSVPANYAFELWGEIVRCLPWIEEELLAGVLPLRLAGSGADMLLPRRTKLVLRLPEERLAQAASLAGAELRIGPSTLSVGESSVRPLRAHSTLHAHMVECYGDEDAFVAELAKELQELQIDCRWICGRRHTVTGTERTISGYSLVVHDLKPNASLLLQGHGLGGARRYGCGIFVPYRTIAGLG